MIKNVLIFIFLTKIYCFLNEKSKRIDVIVAHLEIINFWVIQNKSMTTTFIKRKTLEKE